jgi:hypothetical protein
MIEEMTYYIRIGYVRIGDSIYYDLCDENKCRRVGDRRQSYLT